MSQQMGSNPAGIWISKAKNSLKTSSSKVQITHTCQSFVSSHEEYRSTFLSQVHILIVTEMENEKKKKQVLIHVSYLNNLFPFVIPCCIAVLCNH